MSYTSIRCVHNHRLCIALRNVRSNRLFSSFPNTENEYLYNTHTFRVVEEEEVFHHRFRRTSIEYLIGDASKPAQIRTCELDALRVLAHCQTMFGTPVIVDYLLLCG